MASMTFTPRDRGAALLLALFAFSVPAWAGSLDAPAAPTAGSGMPTTADLYNRHADRRQLHRNVRLTQPTDAWFVNFTQGLPGNHGKNIASRVRLVRSAQ
jgi:hypothetical protein